MAGSKLATGSSAGAISNAIAGHLATKDKARNEMSAGGAVSNLAESFKQMNNFGRKNRNADGTKKDKDNQSPLADANR